ncbi:type II secretion system GspH family protein [Vibrio sp. ZSDE26]|uniref:Type II secretion system GspH family protein n=1 Tax=Vibrio amylolyticus TaxID=2847292 RepID=A0A9X2BJZ6_9VIBR|nr:type II secretion system protein [Vibrio amylolyticus]MCK6262268.1 type II secretion system GspH family protein [Vibrio amylolyticus]
MDDNRSIQQGFTLVELIVVILLIAIVSVYAGTRYLGVSSFSAFTAQEQIISVIRQVQVNRIQTNISDIYTYCNDVGNPDLQELCLRSRVTANSSCVGSSSGCSSSDSTTRSDVVTADKVSFSTTPPLSTITFDLLGNPLGSASGGVSILITAGQSAANVCINPQGYVYGGACL